MPPKLPNIKEEVKQAVGTANEGARVMADKVTNPAKGSFMWNAQSAARAVENKIRDGVINPLANFAREAKTPLVTAATDPGAIVTPALEKAGVNKDLAAGLGFAAGFATPTGKAHILKKVPNIHPEDVQVMVNYIDKVGGVEVLKQAEKLAEYWGIDVNKSAGFISNQFRQILEGGKKVKGTIQRNRDEFGKFSPD